jgi:Flp pilus assembly protein TadB
VRVRNDAAAYAANWKTVILVDAALGWVAVVVGLALASLVGVVLAAVGAAYLVAVWRRLRRWRRLRIERGLPV